MVAETMARRKPNKMPRSYPEMGRLLREDRERLNLSQQEVADTISIAQSYVSQAELGEHRPDPDILRAYARLYEMPYARYAVPAGYMEKPPAGSPLMVPEDVLDDLRDIAAQPPAIVKALRGMMRELKIMYVASGRTDGDPGEDVRGR